MPAFIPNTLEELLAIEEIKLLPSRYAFFFDGGRGEIDESVADLFVEDGVWDSTDNGNVRLEGRAQIAAMFGSMMSGVDFRRPTWYNGGHAAGAPLLMHLMSPVVITRFNGHEAHGIAPFLGNSLHPGSDKMCLQAGRYNDHYVRTADGWRFKARVLEHIMPARMQALGVATLEQTLPGMKERAAGLR